MTPQYYRLNDICGLTGVKPYVLRFWEAEFDRIQSGQNDKGEKVYSDESLMIIEKIKALLFEDKMTIDMAKIELDRWIGQNEEEKKREEDRYSSVASPTITENLAPSDIQQINASTVDLVTELKGLEDTLKKLINVIKPEHWH
jgi:DNA-binding transcriptional MerR regulator